MIATGRGVRVNIGATGSQTIRLSGMLNAFAIRLLHAGQTTDWPRVMRERSCLVIFVRRDSSESVHLLERIKSSMLCVAFLAAIDVLSAQN
jgi:hypothetical protein